jgi:signal transduction histidine kinase
MRKIIMLLPVKLICALFILFICFGTNPILAQNKNSKIDEFDTKINRLMDVGEFDSALFLVEEKLELTKDENLKLEEIRSVKTKGICFELKGEYDKATELLYQALKMAEKFGDKKEISAVHINIGVLYYDLKKADEAIEYYQKALKIAEEIKDTSNMIRSLNNIGNVLMTLKTDPKKAIYYFERTVELAKKTGYDFAVQVGLTNLTQIYTDAKQFDKAFSSAREVLKMQSNGCYANYNMGNLFKVTNNLDSALFYIKIASLDKGADTEFRIQILKEISDIYSKMGLYNNALEFYIKHADLKDSIHTQEAEKNMMEIKARYEAEKKDLQIKQLSLINSKKQNAIIFLSIMAILLIGIGFLIIHNNRKKRLLAVQNLKVKELQISKLENEKLIIASTSAFKGEESERSRLARDLHDGLGGLLTGLKLNMYNMKDHVILDEANQEKFSHALKLLDNCISEMHLVANNMMPEILIRLGIQKAIENYIKKLPEKQDLKIEYQFYGPENRFDLNFELTVYRSVQEIINNALKHAGASSIQLQLISDINRLCATISDNGKGFNPDSVDYKGNGLSNIKARVVAYGGHFDISSSPGKGTEIIIEFENLENYLNNDTTNDC